EFTHPSFVLQPAHTFGPAPAEYLLTESDVVIGARRFLDVLRIAGSPPSLSSLGTVEVSAYPVITINNPLPLAPQTQIDTGDTRILNAVQRNGRVYATHTVSNATNTKTEVAWYEIVPSSPPTLAQQGRVSDPARFYYYPSIAVNANGDIALGFSGSSTTEFAGGYYTARRFGDPAGFTQIVSPLKQGEGPYFKNFGAGQNRWGDYSATVVDPSGNLKFWTLQEYAATPVNTWGTWWGSFVLPPLSTPSDPVGLAATPLSGSTISLAWTDNSSNEESFVIERKTGADPFLGIATPSTSDIAAYTDAFLIERTTYTYRVKAQNSLGDSGFSNESTATTLLGTPGNATAVAASSTLIDISWTNMSALETGYRVERKVGTGGTFVAIATLPADTISYADNSVSAGTFFSYRIQAVDNVTPTVSAYSNEASVTTPGSPAIGGGGGGGGGCLSITLSGGEVSYVTLLFSVGILLLPACALGLRRFFRRQERTVPIRHPLC
ncbi:MAG: fibronectin type III domain-containing protein, partial [Candidatus Deferrimicrobiota bacterium]